MIVSPGMRSVELNISLLLRSLLIGTQASGAHDPEFPGRYGRESLDRSPPTQIIRKVVGGDAVEAAHPFLDVPVVSVAFVTGFESFSLFNRIRNKSEIYIYRWHKEFLEAGEVVNLQ